jgi:chorismate mutase-like protein
MVKKKTSAQLPNDIKDLRVLIDAVDDEIILLLNRRAGLAQKIGEIKTARSEPLYVPERERALLKRLVGKNSGPLPPESLLLIYKEIISASLALEAPLAVSYLGSPTDPTHEAAKRHFGLSARLSPCQSISDIFTEVEKGGTEYGVVPLETSGEGVVTHTLDLFAASRLQICAEVLLESSHLLLTRSLNRFFVIGHNGPRASGSDRTSIMFALKDKPGVLLHALERFAKVGINMTRIESRPWERRDWDYMFYVDFDGHREDPQVAACLQSLESMCVFFRVLGSYPRGETVGGKLGSKRAVK